MIIFQHTNVGWTKTNLLQQVLNLSPLDYCPSVIGILSSGWCVPVWFIIMDWRMVTHKWALSVRISTQPAVSGDQNCQPYQRSTNWAIMLAVYFVNIFVLPISLFPQLILRLQVQLPLNSICLCSTQIENNIPS